jgi:DNA-binding NtrC family response regulator
MSEASPRRKPQVLVADDEETLRTLLRYNISKLGYEVIVAEDGRQAIDLMTEDIAACLLDLKMPVLDGLAALESIKRTYPEVPVVMISAHGQVKDAVEAIRRGALDYVTKPFDLDELLAIVRQAVTVGRGLKEGARLHQAVSTSRPEGEFGGTSDAASRLRGQVEKIASLGSTVLITGESGTGKSLLARVIHYSGARAKGPFISVSCPSLPRELLESEMFGHERGAFTGALQRRIGRAEMAEGGTLFLDEVGDLPLSLQPKLLTFLQDRVFQRVGGSENIEADVRVIAATNADLAEKVRNREFREDLFFRLNVIPLRLPPLRSRREDIVPLAEAFLDSVARERKTRPCRIGAEARGVLERYHWPGNVREMENVLERASAFASDGVIQRNDLPEDLLAADGASEASGPASDSAGGLQLGGIPLAALEETALRQTLELCRGNKTEAARRLGVSGKTIYNMMARYGVS